MTELVKQLSYSVKNDLIPRYRYVKLSLNNLSSSTVSIPVSSNTMLEWRLPANTVYNLSKSFIQYNYTIPALANNVGIIHCGQEVRQVQFGDQSQNITDLQYADLRKSHALPVALKRSEFLTRDVMSGFFPSWQLNTSNILANSRDGLLVGTQYASSIPYQEQQYLEMGTAVNTAVNIYRQVPLGDLAFNSYPSLDIDVPFSKDMYFRCFINPLNRFAWQTTSPATPGIAANSTQLVAAVNFSNVYLFLAVQENLDIKNELLNALAAGSIKLQIPYVYQYVVSGAGNASSHSFSLTLTKAYGSTLKEITVVPFQATNQTYAVYDHANVNASKIATIQTSINGRPLTDSVINCLNPYSSIAPTNTPFGTLPSEFGSDYREMKKFCEGSVIQNYSQFQSNWFYKDSFCNISKLDEVINIPQWRFTEGIDLQNSGEVNYQMSATCPAITAVTNSCYTAGILYLVDVLFSRMLEVSPSGFSMYN